MPYAGVPSASAYSTSPDCYGIIYSFDLPDTVPADGITTISQSFSGGRPLAKPLGLNGIIYDGDLQEALKVTSHNIDSDIISFEMTKSKERAAGSWEMVLGSDKDYHALINNGDQILMWLRRDGGARIYDNSVASGFKLWGVVTSVRKSRATDSDGRKTTRYHVSGEDFGRFFETEIFYNPIISDLLNQGGTAIAYLTLQGAFGFWNSPEVNAVTILKAYLGNNLNTSWLPAGLAPNDVFLLPGPIQQFFNAKTPTVAGCLTLQAGLMTYSPDQAVPSDTKTLPGFKLLKVDPGMGGSLWSIIAGHANAAMNEMFLEMKVDSTGMKMVPTFVLRQIPYTSDEGAKELSSSLPTPIPTTQFSSLPRFRLPESAIRFEDIGKSEANRVNYIQLTGTGAPDNGLGDQTVQQTLLGNFAIDKRSIARYGLHTKLPQTDHDLRFSQAQPRGVTSAAFSSLGIQALLHPRAEPTSFVASQPNQLAATTPIGASGQGISMVGDWIRVIADWWTRYHLYDTGSFRTIGIEEPIGIGDNLEVVRADGSIELYHVTTYTHEFSVQRDGLKSFSSHIAVTRGQTEDGKPLSETPGGNSFPVNFSTVP